MIKLEYEPPPADLTPYISAYYYFQIDEPLMEDLERADIAQFRVILEGSGSVIFGDGYADSFHEVSMVGPRTKSSKVRIIGPGRLFGVGLLPAGWAAVTKRHADAHVNRIIDGRDVMGEGATALAATLRSMTSFADMVAYTNDVSRSYYDSAQAVPHWFIRAVDDWLGAQFSPDIADLETATGLSRRQIERLCKQLYGSPPKLLVRKYRALRTANAIARGRGEWQDFVDEGGYYDQSHCIREIKEFTGITPSAIRDHVSRLTTMTLDRSMLFKWLGPLAELT